MGPTRGGLREDFDKFWGVLQFFDILSSRNRLLYVIFVKVRHCKDAWGMPAKLGSLRNSVPNERGMPLRA